MPPSAHKASEKALNSKRAKRQTATKPNYFEGNSSEIDSPEDYDPMMTDTAFDGGDSEFGVEPMRIDDEESMRRFNDEREEGEASEDHRETQVDQKKEKKRQEILDRIERFQKEFISRKDEIFKESIRQINQDIKAMREGTHPEYEERLQQLIDKREQTLEKARLYRDYRLECVEKMFDAEQRQVEEDYLVEKQGLKEQMLADMDERRKKLKEDFESFDITSDAAMDGNQRYHPQRKLRARQKEDTEVKVKKTKVTDILIYVDFKSRDFHCTINFVIPLCKYFLNSCVIRPSVSARLLESEINDDLAEIGKVSPIRKLVPSHHKKK